ncbi:hypothetical protein [Fluviicola taffensis]|uniref:hypothetical protein n=1 Tax=Fluviicola taffensis TaxID=191579 RepID=UPI0031380C46
MTENTGNVENMISSITDSLIQNKALEISETENTKKLNLWIIGLSTGVEMFMLNKISYSETYGFETFLFIVAGAFFMYNAFTGLYMNKTIVTVNNIDIADQRKLIYQKMMMIGLLKSNSNSNYAQEMLDDFHSGEMTLKMTNLNYFSSMKKEGEIILRVAKNLNSLSEKYTTIALIIQFSATIILFFIN